MYAVIKSGGKQYTVKPGDILRVEKLDAELGAELNLTDVLLVGGDNNTYVGDDVRKAQVTVVVTNQQRGPKVIVFKKKRRQGYRRMGGHRQPYTELFVKSITTPNGQTVNADKQPVVFNPEKKLQKLAKAEEIRKEARQKAREAGKAEPKVEKEAKAARKPAAKKKVVKKAKKKVAKKATKKVARKKAAKKK